MAGPFECPGQQGRARVPVLPTVTRSRAGARTIRLSSKNGGGMVTVAGRARGPGPYPVPVDRVESADCRLAGMAASRRATAGRRGRCGAAGLPGVSVEWTVTRLHSLRLSG